MRKRSSPNSPEAKIAALRREFEALERDLGEISRAAARETAAAQEWEQHAMHAVAAGNDDLAREALTRCNEHQQAAAAYRAELEQLEVVRGEYQETLALLARYQPPPTTPPPLPPRPPMLQ